MYSLFGFDMENTKPSLEMMKRLMHPKEKKVFDRLVEKEIRLKQYFTMECRLSVKEYGFRWFRLRVVGSFDSNGDLSKLIGSLVNIHSEKTSRLQLQREKDKAVATLNSIVDAVITTSAEGVIEYQNSAAERLTGISMDQAKGMRIEQAISFYQEHSLKDIDYPILSCLESGRRMNQKIYADMLDKDGTRYTVQVMATPLVGNDNQIFGAVLVLNDVTNIRVLSRRLKYQAAILDTAGWVNYRAGNINKAIELLEKAVALAPDAGELHYHLGMAYSSENGDIEKAKQHLKIATESEQEYMGKDQAKEKLEKLVQSISG